MIDAATMMLNLHTNENNYIKLQIVLNINSTHNNVCMLGKQNNSIVAMYTLHTMCSYYVKLRYISISATN